MLKKVIPIVVVLCLILGVRAMAENTSDVTDGSSAGTSQQMPQGEFTPPEDFTPLEGLTPPQNAGEFAPPENSKNNAEAVTPSANENVTTEKQQTQENGEDSTQTQGGNRQLGGQMPGGMGGFPGNMQNFNGQTQEEQSKGFLGFVKTYSTPITSVVLLGLAFIFVIFYRRKNY